MLDAFAREMEHRLGTPGAIARVAVWGRVAGFAPDDDWRFTLRAQYARLDGPLELAPEHEPHGVDLVHRHGVN